MYIETPKPPLHLGFRLTVYLSPQFLQFNGRLYHPSLPHLAVERIKLSMAPSLQSHYSPSSLLRATPPSCCLRPLSCVHSYRTYLVPGISPRGIQDFSSFCRLPVTVSPPLPRRCRLFL